tara:strand:- start:135 stop:1310 length:1176 start_codon:yes stop_codon:yes gene_type:complete
VLEDFIGELLAIAIILLGIIIYTNFKPRNEKLDEVIEEKITLLASDAATKAAENALDSAMKSNMKIQKKDWELYKKDLVEVVNPVTQSVNVLDKKVEQLEKERKEDIGALKNSIEGLLKQSSDLNDTTITLSQALKSTSIQGDWGETQLQNIVESCGMINHVDFEEQESTQHGRDIPDMIIKLPDGGIIPVDSKCSMNDFRKSLEADDEDQRIQLQKDHASKCRNHMNTLATKKYGEQYDGPIDFTVMLIPFEPGFQAALMHDKELFSDGAKKKVFIASPISLFPLLRLVDQSWRQLTLTKNAGEIIKAAQELKKRLKKYSTLYDDVGKKITRLTTAYNDSVGSFKKRLKPSIRDIIKLEGSEDDSAQVKIVKSEIKPVIERVEERDQDSD